MKHKTILKSTLFPFQVRLHTSAIATLFEGSACRGQNGWGHFHSCRSCSTLLIDAAGRNNYDIPLMQN